MADPIASGGGLVPLQSLRHSINVGTHAFRRLGAMSVSSSLDPAAPLVHYESPQSHTAESLPFARSLLASSGVSGWLFLVAPGLSSDASGRSHGLLYARSDAICEAAKAHSAAQKDKAKEEPGVYKKTDLPLTDKLWKFLPVEVDCTLMTRRGALDLALSLGGYQPLSMRIQFCFAPHPTHDCLCDLLFVCSPGLHLACLFQSHLRFPVRVYDNAHPAVLPIDLAYRQP